MKNSFSNIMAVVMASVVSISILASTQANAATPPEMEAWLKASKLGAYNTNENWSEIVANAKKEGEVVVYTSSGRISKLVKPFNALYPEIKLTVHDLGSVKSVEKTIREQDANIFNADIVTTGNSGQVIYGMVNKNYLVNYVPQAYMDRIPKEGRDPLLVRVKEAMVVFYNAEAYPSAPPIKNLWELTEAKYKGRVGMKNPMSSGSTLMGVMTLIQNADEMAAAYQRYAGKPIELSEGVEDAGQEFFARLLANDLVIFKSGSKLAGASGKKGQEKPLIAFANMTYIARNESKGYVNKILADVDPVAKLVYPTFTAIARQAPHPNAAKLFTAYLLGSTDLNKNSNIAKPYMEGASLDLLQGLAPYYDPGSVSPRSDVPLPAGGEIWSAMKGWDVDPEFMWKQGPKMRDFWLVHSSK
jgi:iron(III) transport system substrate-binding protein